MAKSNRSVEKEAFWRLVLEEFRASGLSIRAFCRREGLSEPSFFAWRRTFQERDAAKPAARRKQVKGIPVDKLIPVDIVDPIDCEPTPATLEVITPGGFTLRFHPDIRPQQLDAVLGVIAHCHGAASC